MARISFASAISAIALVLGATAVQAQPRATVVIDVGGPQYRHAPPVHVQYGPPPPPRYEATPRPRRGMVWAPGHWEWRGGRHVWREGQWMKARPGQHYREPRWVERNGRWHMESGRWDRDGDGVPDRYDRRPNDPYRR